MRIMWKGFLGMLTVISFLALSTGYLFAAATLPAPGQAALGTTYAPMKLTITEKCVEQGAATPVGTSTTKFQYPAESVTYKNTDIISLLSSAHVTCTATGAAFPTTLDVAKASLYYQYDGATAFNVYVSTNGVITDAAHTVEITPACVAVNFPTTAYSVWSGTEEVSGTAFTKANLTGQYEMAIVISIPGASATAKGIYLGLAGLTKETYSVTAPNSKKIQTMNDSVTLNTEAFGFQHAGTADPETTCRVATPDAGCVPVACTGTVQAKGKITK